DSCNTRSGQREIRIGILAEVPINFAMIRLVALAMLALIPVVSTAKAEEARRLSADQMTKPVGTDSITVPTPGELFAALAKTEKINWSAQYRGPMPTTYSNRAQIAL